MAGVSRRCWSGPAFLWHGGSRSPSDKPAPCRASELADGGRRRPDAPHRRLQGRRLAGDAGRTTASPRSRSATTRRRIASTASTSRPPTRRPRRRPSWRTIPTSRASTSTSFASIPPDEERRRNRRPRTPRPARWRPSASGSARRRHGSVPQRRLLQVPVAHAPDGHAGRLEAGQRQGRRGRRHRHGRHQGRRPGRDQVRPRLQLRRQQRQRRRRPRPRHARRRARSPQSTNNKLGVAGVALRRRHHAAQGAVARAARARWPASRRRSAGRPTTAPTSST